MKTFEGIKENHITRFSRLAQEMQQLIEEIRSYCPEADIWLHNTQEIELGFMSREDEAYADYQYSVVMSERLDCESINDVGSKNYDIIDEERMEKLRYRKPAKNKDDLYLSDYGVNKTIYDIRTNGFTRSSKKSFVNASIPYGMNIGKRLVEDNLRVVKRGTEEYEDEVWPFLNGYRNSRDGTTKEEEERFVREHLHIKLID